MKFKKIILLPVLILLFSTVGYAQNNIDKRANKKTVDSLFNIIKSDNSNSEKSNAVLNVFNYLNEFERNTILLDSAANMAFELGLQMHKEKDTLALANLLFSIGNYYYINRKFDLSVTYIDSASVLFQQINNISSVINCYDFLVSVYSLKNFPKVAIQYIYKSINLLNEIHDTVGLASPYGNLGRLYLYDDQPMKSNEALNKSISLSKTEQYHIYPYKVENFLKLNEPDSAKYNLLLAAPLANSKTLYQPPYFFRAKAYYYKYINEFDSSSNYFLKAIAGFEAAIQKHHIAQCFTELGEIAFQKEEYEKSEKYFLNAVDYAKKNERYKFLLTAYLGLSKIYEKQNRKDKGFDVLKEAQAIRDTLKRLEASEFFISQELQYQFNQKENLLKEAQLKKEFEKQALVNEQRQTKIIASVIILFLSVFSLIFLLQRNKISKEKHRSDELLLNILPSEVAEELKTKGTAEAKYFDNVTVLFTDFKSFTSISEKLSPQQLVDELHECFSAFDNIIQKYGIEKIKTVGDAYLAVSGLPVANPNNASDIISAAIEIQNFISKRISKAPFGGLKAVRIGIHSGSVVAGIVGVKKFSYDIWGDTVNTAARMEQNGEAGKINISETTFELVKDKFNCTYRGKIAAKNKGEMDMYFVEGTINTLKATN